MAYTGTQGGIGLGVTISIGTTLIGELKKMNLAGRQAGTDDMTNFASSAREFLPTLITSGTWDISGNRVGGDAGQLAMEAAFTALKLSSFTIQLPKTQGQSVIGDSFTFTALIESMDYGLEFDKSQSFTAKLKVSGILTITAGN